MSNMISLEGELNSNLSELREEETELAKIQKKIGGLRKAIEESMIALGFEAHLHPNYTLSFRDNSPRHNMDWKKFKQHHADTYKRLQVLKIFKITPIKKPRSLVLTKVKVKK